MPEKVEEITVSVTIHENIGPVDRGDRYEDPIDEMLQEKGWGEVTGGGTQLKDGGGIAYVDISFAIKAEHRDNGLAIIIAMLEAAGVPKGTKLTVFENDGEEVFEIGRTEGVALWLDGVNLPDEVYEKFGLGKLYDEFDKIFDEEKFEDVHEIQPDETMTAVLLYSADREDLKRRLEPIRASFPLCENSKLEDI